LFSIFNFIKSFNFQKLTLKTQPPTSTIYWISLSCKHSMKSAQRSSSEDFLIVTTFFKVITCVCFLTDESLKRSFNKTMIARWFNPPGFSFCNETEITLQLVNRHSTVAEQNLWF
jgi:hypothetical protein